MDLRILGFALAAGLVAALNPCGFAVQRYLPAVTVVIGVGLIGLGSWMLTGRQLTLLLPKPSRGAPTARLGSSSCVVGFQDSRPQESITGGCPS